MVTIPLEADIGVKGGMSLSGVLSSTGDFRHVLGYEIDGLPMGNLWGFQVGFFKTFDLSRRFQIQPEIFYTLRGGDASERYIYDNIIYKIRIFYIEFPLLLKFKIVAGRSFSTAILAGPYAALKLKAEKQTRIWNEEEVTALQNVKTFDYGLLLGLGVEYDIGFGRVLLDLRSGLGLNNIMDVPSDTIRLYADKDRIRNFYASILAGYAF
jgi:hypothetical protein